MASIVVSGDTSGAVTLEAPAIAGTTTLTLPTTSGTVLTTASTTGVNASAISTGTLAQAYGGTGTTTGYYGFKNRIINGAMVIDQRNAGASVNATTTNGVFPVDRFVGLASDGTGSFTLQRSTVAPTGFTNSIIATVGTTFSPSGSNQYNIRHNIEGFNVADLGWGTANAQSVTLSFWVRSSVTGTYGGSLSNSAFNRSYPFTFVINAANTYEYKTITIAGDTTGTWLTDNGIGIRLCISLGAGATLQGTAGAWAASAFTSATGTTNWISNSGATFYITGVQLEVGSTATSFDYRPYGTELQLCQRYFQTFSKPALRGVANSATALNRLGMPILVTMRATPTLSLSGTIDWYDGANTGTLTTIVTQYSTISSIEIDASAATGTTATFRTIVCYVGSNTGTITASAEL